MEYVIYCDESRHDSNGGHQCMTIGGLWVPRSRRDEISKKLSRLRTEMGLAGEMKWSKVSERRLADYQRIVDFFFDCPDLNFRCIVADHGKLDHHQFHGGDRELGFYKFYFEMLEKWMLPGNRYLVLLDFKTNKGADRFTSLKRTLENKTRGQAWIDDLTVIESHESTLAQLVDLLTGAVAASWCDLDPTRPKGRLATYIGQRRGASLLAHDTHPILNKFNIFEREFE